MSLLGQNHPLKGKFSGSAHRLTFLPELYADLSNSKENKNSSGDEIANVNFYAVRPGSYPNSLK